VTAAVIYRRGELSKDTIDRDWPHQVALPAARCTGRNYVTIHLFCDNHFLITHKYPTRGKR
jgi:hypothetical protein